MNQAKYQLKTRKKRENHFLKVLVATHQAFDLCLHYTPMHYTAILHGYKKVNFQMKNYIFFLFLVLNLCFRAKIRYTPVNPDFTI